MKTIHLISHSHWDREWYGTFQQFRLRLIHLMDEVLDILAHNQDFKHFMLDGQTIILDDYLLMRPEAEPAIREAIRKGRIVIGPWHILPDMYLVSPEAHIRNLLAGEREARRFGPRMMISYMPDSFGHIGQMPQILHGFGIDSACVWRGLDDQPNEFWWESPDGSRVLMLYLRDSYSNGASLNASDPSQFAKQIKQEADSLAQHTSTSHVLVMYGTDHMEPPPETAIAIQAANKVLKDYRILHSTLPKYLAAIKPYTKNQKSKLPTIIGELRSCKRSPLLPGVLSTRMWIKQRNHACENLLEKWTEPFSTFASLAATGREPQTRIQQPSGIIRQAWQLLMECHPHDSICGSSIDQVHEEMKPRFGQVEQIGEEITKQSLEALARAIKTTPRHLQMNRVKSVVVVFNPLSWQRTDVVTTEISLPPGEPDFEIIDGKGNVMPHQSASGKATELINIRVRREELGGLLSMVHEGIVGNMAVQEINFERTGANLRIEAIFMEDTSPKTNLWNDSLKVFQEYIKDSSIETFHIHARTPDSARVTFAAPVIPALGWKTFYIRSKEVRPTEIKVTAIMRLMARLAASPLGQRLQARLARPNTRPPYAIENDLYSVKLNLNDLTMAVTDKTTGAVHRGLNRFEDTGDRGDEYNFSPPEENSIQDKPKLRGVTIQRGPVRQTMTVSLALPVPADLSANRKSRSKEMVELPIKTTITLTQGIGRVDVHTKVTNQAKDHRLRVHFRAEMPMVEAASYDGHFEIVKRHIGIRPYDPEWVEEPRPEVPQHAFTSITNGGRTMTIANRGLPEAEVLRASSKGESKPEIALTLLRCIGWLSRDDLSTRKDHAGPFLETPGAQMPGEWEFDYSIIMGSDPRQTYQEAWNFDSPLRAAATDLHAGTLSSTGSFIRVSDPSFFISSVKEREDGTGWIVRGYNIGDENIPVVITPWRKFKKAERVNMAEERIGKLRVGTHGEVTVNVHGHEVMTVMFDQL